MATLTRQANLETLCLCQIDCTKFNPCLDALSESPPPLSNPPSCWPGRRRFAVSTRKTAKPIPTPGTTARDVQKASPALCLVKWKGYGKTSARPGMIAVRHNPTMTKTRTLAEGPLCNPDKFVPELFRHILLAMRVSNLTKSQSLALGTSDLTLASHDATTHQHRAGR